VARLTALFMDARYGREEPDGAGIAEAERVADEARRALSHLRPPARARR
jgi:hypothetical protein